MPDPDEALLDAHAAQVAANAAIPIEDARKIITALLEVDRRRGERVLDAWRLPAPAATGGQLDAWRLPPHGGLWSLPPTRGDHQ